MTCSILLLLNESFLVPEIAINHAKVVIHHLLIDIITSIGIYNIMSVSALA